MYALALRSLRMCLGGRGEGVQTFLQDCMEGGLGGHIIPFVFPHVTVKSAVISINQVALQTHLHECGLLHIRKIKICRVSRKRYPLLYL